MFANLNYIHIFVAGIVYFIIGALWYSVLFGKIWAGMLGLVPAEADKKQMPRMFATTFALNLVITFSTACVLHFVDPGTCVGALKTGLLLGVGFTLTSTAMNNMYAKRPFKLTLIDAGYHITGICVAALILTRWM